MIFPSACSMLTAMHALISLPAISKRRFTSLTFGKTRKKLGSRFLHATVNIPRHEALQYEHFSSETMIRDGSPRAAVAMDAPSRPSDPISRSSETCTIDASPTRSMSYIGLSRRRPPLNFLPFVPVVGGGAFEGNRKRVSARASRAAGTIVACRSMTTFGASAKKFHCQRSELLGTRMNGCERR